MVVFAPVHFAQESQKLAEANAEKARLSAIEAERQANIAKQQEALAKANEKKATIRLRYSIFCHRFGSVKLRMEVFREINSSSSNKNGI